MRKITLGDLAAAVSNSGGYGQVAASGLSEERLRAEIKKAKALTSKPIGVNIPLHRPNALEALEIAVEMEIRTITTSGGSPKKIMDRVRAAGLKVFHKVSTTDMGLKAQDAGVDGVIAMGFEAGGHGGRDQVTTFCLVPQLADVLDIPVIASGGIGDARGIVAAFALGAEGVEIGTRFAATRECPVPAYYKEAIVSARDRDTLVLGQDIMPLRALRNPVVERLADPKASGQVGLLASGYLESDGSAQTSIMPSGQVAGLIHGIETVSDLFAEWIGHAREVSKRLNALFGEGTS
jgi:enoyl-[acyl-carrier protein] reductase II